MEAGARSARDAGASWSPSALFDLAEEVVERAVDGPVHVRGRVVDTGASRAGTQFVTIVDEDQTAPTWDTPRLGLVVFAWRAQWFERPLGGPVSEALATGTVIDAVGELGLAPGEGALQLRVQSLAVASDSTDAADKAALRARMQAEDWVAERPPLPRVLRRVGALISVAGDGDLDEALRLVEHDPAAPAFCRHRIHPLSATAVHDVPRLLDHHVAADVDAVLIAFGGHLPAVSAWDSAAVLGAIRRCHHAGIPVVAGFAHGSDQPLTKLLAHNRGQASAAVTTLVAHNRQLLGRLPTALRDGIGQVDGARSRVAATTVDALRRSAAAPGAVARRRHRAVVLEVGRVARAADDLTRVDRLAPRLRRTVDALGDPRATLQRQLGDSLVQVGGAVGRVRTDLDRRHEVAGRLPGLLRRGFAVVTDGDGQPLPAGRPATGSSIRVTTATATFAATVDSAQPTAEHDPPHDPDPTEEPHDD